jgi:tetratricopeptide (TPR) repeat protein
VPYAQAGVGAVVSQFETDPNYGPGGLALLAQGMSPEDTLKKLLAEDGNFDGKGMESRQVALETDLTLQYLSVAFAQGPAWPEVEIGSGQFAVLGRNPLFQRWVTNDKRQQAAQEYQETKRLGNPTEKKQEQIARKLLEAGLSEEALTVLSSVANEQPGNPMVHSLLAEAYAARNDYRQAEKECQTALQLRPDDFRLRAQLLHLQVERVH